MSYHKILIAVDSSEYSLKAAEKGVELARQLQAEVAFLFVIDDSKAVENPDAGITKEEALIVLKKEAENTLDNLGNWYDSNSVTKLIPEGLPGIEIIKTSKAWYADIIVLGTHGRTGLLHLLMGSVAEYVVRNSKIPVLIIPFI